MLKKAKISLRNFRRLCHPRPALPHDTPHRGVILAHSPQHLYLRQLIGYCVTRKQTQKKHPFGVFSS